jgi:hypothetical protein
LQEQRRVQQRQRQQEQQLVQQRQQQRVQQVLQRQQVRAQLQEPLPLFYRKQPEQQQR